MGCLGGGLSLHAISSHVQHTGVGENTLRVFFIKFVKHYAEEILPKVLAMPTTKEDLDVLTREYTLAGFPGAIGSMDCTR